MSQRGSDYVFTFSYETYSDARARGMMRPPDRIMAALMESENVDRLLVANPLRWAPTAIARRLARYEAVFPETARRKLVSPLRARRNDPTDLTALEADYRAYEGTLRRASLSMGMDRPSVLTVNPIVAGFPAFDWARDVTYYGRDDWLSSPARQEYWPAYREAYRRIAERGIAVAAVSQEIIDRISPTGPHAVVPNGVEPAEWVGPLPDEPAWFAAIPGPRAVYVGTVDSRLDIDGIAALAVARPELQIVLVGPLVDLPLIAPLRAHSNITIHDRVDRAAVVAVLRGAELTLVAHRRTALTEAMSPLKIYEYLAAGAPVLSIDLGPVRGLGPHVFLSETVGDFIDLADEALAQPRATEAQRLAFIAANSWHARHETILALHGSPTTGADTDMTTEANT
jgi:teichuronic acid biosynthesis glycosyltransferase TuaH